MSNSAKPFVDYDEQQILQKVYNPTDASLAVGSFVAAELNNNIQFSYPNNITDTISFFEGATLLYTLTIVYVDSSQAKILSVTRTT